MESCKLCGMRIVGDADVMAARRLRTRLRSGAKLCEGAAFEEREEF